MEYVNLFSNSARSMRVGDRVADYEGGNICALDLGDGRLALETSTINYADTRVFGAGELRPVQKRSERYPDVKGYLEKPEGEGRWEVAGWWRATKDGEAYLAIKLQDASTGTARGRGRSPRNSASREGVSERAGAADNAPHRPSIPSDPYARLLQELAVEAGLVGADEDIYRHNLGHLSKLLKSWIAVRR